MGAIQSGAVLAAVMLALAGCAPCSEDEFEPNNAEGEAAAAPEEVTFDLNELDINFHDQHDVDCLSYTIPEPRNVDVTTLYIDLKGGDKEEIEVTLTFSCDDADIVKFTCNGETPDDPVCSITGKEPNLSITYDCDESDENLLGPSSFVVCMTRPNPVKECVDYTARVYLN